MRGAWRVRWTLIAGVLVLVTLLGLERTLRRSADAQEAGAPSYEVTAKELEKTQLYMWQVAPEVRERIDSERLRMGNIAVAAYLIHLVNDWLGHPMGLPLKVGSRKTG